MKVISPKSSFHFYWELLLYVILIYSTIQVPLRVTFFDVRRIPPILVIDTIIDAIIFLDILKRFNTGFYNDDFYSDINLEKSKIRRRYFRKWFIVDMLSCLPTDLIFSYRLDSIWWNFFNRLKLLKLSRLFRFNLIFAYLRKSHHSNLTTLVRQLSMLVSVIFIIAHLTACFWFELADQSIIDINSNYSGTNDSWILSYYSKISMNELNYLFSLYVTSLYWSTSTLTTVGFGDVVPVTMPERLYACSVAFMGSFLTGYIISSTTAALGRAYKAKAAYREEMDKINAYLRYREVSTKLSTKVLQYYKSLLAKKTLFDEQMILQNLSLPLRAEFTAFLFKDSMKGIPAFAAAEDPSFLAKIMLYLCPTSVGAGDLLFKEGEVALDMYFVVKGHFIARKEADSNFMREFKGGSFFGEEVLVFKNDEKSIRREYSIGATVQGDIFSLSKRDYIVVLEEFPELLATVQVGQKRNSLIEQNTQLKTKYEALVEEHKTLLLHVHKSNEQLKNIRARLTKRDQVGK